MSREHLIRPSFQVGDNVEFKSTAKLELGNNMPNFDFEGIYEIHTISARHLVLVIPNTRVRLEFKFKGNKRFSYYEKFLSRVRKN